ncbi:type III restriction enzyme, res subunit [Halobacteriovorax sp. BALOs_7]|uniref:DEAD/DEAH box helicase n=1 Tax=Halobacteriovorax sp. BALOs_7 TaxID=2109558 RepID=UPI000EA38181|nr:DEAD/DEAH box helicase [Halobacteriovorax sp. BALOs_7]AYF45049.1 type III restriction enzyme, res subunit [Halobacteriovorax sp. BALOs_7]
MKFKLRDYQVEAVERVISHFRKTKDPSLIVLPTGAGKSLVIAELARVAKGRVLVLAHVKELVEQNHAKYESYDLKAGIFSASMKRKDYNDKVIFGSIQSVARADDKFFKDFSLIIIDECHRISLEKETQYQQVFEKIKKANEKVFFLGLTATPYRLGMGWIYNYHYHEILRTNEERFFKFCLYELPLSYMIKNGYLTRPIKIDSPVACYDFSKLEVNEDSGRYLTQEIEKILEDSARVTPGIVKHIVQEAKDRRGVMLFTSTVKHANEVLSHLPENESAIVTGETPQEDRDLLITHFKNQEIKYLVNVSVLTTGFDAPHVDLIAILRPTESISLYQQIVGRGLRLFEGKQDCLILDYTGLDHDIFKPEVGEVKPSGDTQEVQVMCPDCGHANIFWGKMDSEGNITEHYGRKCQGIHLDEVTMDVQECGFLFRFKSCDNCGQSNDISAHICAHCEHELRDADKKLKEAMQLKDAHIMRVEEMFFKQYQGKKGRSLEVSYFDVNGESLKEYFQLNTQSQRMAFYHAFVKKHLKRSDLKYKVDDIEKVIQDRMFFRKPKFVIARKKQRFWQVREKIFLEEINSKRYL